MTQESPAATQLRAAGLRITSPRVAVLQALTHHSHPDADTLTRAVRERLGAVSAQAIYDVLAASAAPTWSAGSNRPDRPPGSRSRPATGITTWSAATDAEVTFWGLCPACQS